ncbi:MAG: arsenite methyltransferase [Planctomycetota bacterium]
MSDSASDITNDGVREAVRRNYAAVAKARAPGCCPAPPAETKTDPQGCCSSKSAASCCDSAPSSADTASAQMGYSAEELASVPEGANLGLGCGNPQAIASLRVGEVVVDLGSGGGFDCFLAARQVGEEGRVIGVDMTPEMISKARANARAAGFANVEFRLGEIEHLPVADGTADVIISNCVINLSPEKHEVFRDAFRALKPGGRLAVTDIIATSPLPPEIKSDIEAISGCVAGAAERADIEAWLGEAGFEDIAVTPVEESRELIRQWAPGRNIEDYVVSATIEARKPGA